MKTLTQKLEELSGWTLTDDSILAFHKDTRVSSDLPLRACGCGVKIDLDHIVYPAFKHLNELHNNAMTNEVVKRRDCYSSKKQIKSLTRKIITNNFDLALKDVLDLYKSKNPELIIELYSSAFNIYREFDQLKNQFADQQQHKFEFLIKLETEIAKYKPDFKLTVAKGHSIQGEVDFIMLDFIELGEAGSTNKLINNDTIITGDSVVEPHSLISIFIAFNNALNDLLIYGGYKNITFYPVYDGTAEQIVFFKKGFDVYKEFMSQRGIDIKIEDQGPLNTGAHMIGATVTSETSKEATSFDKLLPEQKILLTHCLGDLALLSVHRSQFLKNQIDPATAKERVEVLQKLTSPHILLSKIVSEFLPESGSEFKPEMHVSFVSDVSGPGLSVLEEAAESSMVDLSIHTIKFNNENVLNFPRKNYTTSTNGPWLIIGNEQVLQKLMSKLHKAGFIEAHIIGEVLEKSTAPKIYVDKKLRDYFSESNFKNDLFYPKITIQSEDAKKQMTCSLFNKLALKD